MRRSLRALAGAGALVVLLSLPSPSAAAATQAPELRWSPTELAFAQRINGYRRAHGQRRLVLDKAIGRVARRHSCDMRAAGTLSHQSVAQVSRRLVRWRAYGENVGRGDDVQQLWRAFLNSPDHRDNIVAGWGAPGYLGVAVRSDEMGLLWVTMSFTSGDPLTTLGRHPDAC